MSAFEHHPDDTTSRTQPSRRGVLGGITASTFGLALSVAGAGGAAPAATARTAAGLGTAASSVNHRLTGPQTRLESTAVFTVVGVTWAQNAAVQPRSVRVRINDRARGWQPWQNLELEDAPEGLSRTQTRGTAPLTVSESVGVEVQVQTGSQAQVPDRLTLVLGHSPIAPVLRLNTDAGLKASTVDQLGLDKQQADTLGRADVSSTTTAPSLPPTTVPAPAIITRAMWGADESITTDFHRTVEVRGITIHHTGSTNNYTATVEAEAQQLRNIHRYHAVSLGWGDIAYSFIHGRSGAVYQGRSRALTEPVMGYHAAGMNHQAVGVALLGNFSQIQPPPVMIDALVSTLAWLCDRYTLDPRGTAMFVSNASSANSSSQFQVGQQVRLDVLFGHHQSSRTACPGDYVIPRLPEIRQGVHRAIETARAPKVHVAAAVPQWAIINVANPLRAAPAWDATVIRQLSPGMAVTLTGRANRGWREVITPDARKGWFSIEWLRVVAPIIGWTMFTAAGALRGTANATRAVTYTARAWSSALVLREANGWLLVATDSRIGWVQASGTTGTQVLNHHLGITEAISAHVEPWRTAARAAVLGRSTSWLTTARVHGEWIEIIHPATADTVWVLAASTTGAVAR